MRVYCCHRLYQRPPAPHLPLGRASPDLRMRLWLWLTSPLGWRLLSLCLSLGRASPDLRMRLVAVADFSPGLASSLSRFHSFYLSLSLPLYWQSTEVTNTEYAPIKDTVFSVSISFSFLFLE